MTWLLALAACGTWSLPGTARAQDCNDPLTIEPVTLDQAHVDFPVDYRAVQNHSGCGTTLNWQVVDGPPGFEIDGAGGLFYWTPEVADPAVTITIRVNEYQGGQLVATDDETFTVRVDDNTMLDPIFRDYINAARMEPSDQFTIRGRAYGEGFQGYTLSYAHRYQTDNWITITGSTTPVDGVSSDVLGAWDLSGFPDGSWLHLKLEVDMGTYVSVVENQVIVDRTLKAGWHQKVAAISHGPAVADLTDDGLAEVVAVTHSGDLHVWSIEGDELAMTDVDSAATNSGAAIGDVTGDGRPEVVWTSMVMPTFEWAVRGHRLDFDPMSGTYHLTEVFRYILPFPGHELCQTPSLADVDGDGDLDIAVATSPWSEPAHAYVLWYAHDPENGFEGRLLPFPGWPVPTTPDEPMSAASPTIADLDGQGGPEIIVAGRERAFAWHIDGSEHWVGGAPLTDPITDASTHAGTSTTATSQPAVADLDQDGSPEVVIGTNVLTHDGAAHPAWPHPAGTPSLSAALGDVDHDGFLEIVLGQHAWNLDGTEAVGPPFNSAYWLANAVLGDCGQGHTDIVSGSRFDNGKSGFHGYEGHDGSVTHGYPKVLFGHALDVGGAHIGDFDGDDVVDMAVTVTDPNYGGIVAVYSMDGPNHDEHHEWPALGHDVRRTGRYRLPRPNRPRLEALTASSDDVRITWTDRSAVEAGYRIERGEEPFDWMVIGETGPDTTEFYDVPPAEGRWRYRVSAYRIDPNTGEEITSFPSLPGEVDFPAVLVCDPAVMGAGDGCDCGCGLPDPDCGGLGCTEAGCIDAACDTCHAPDGTAISCVVHFVDASATGAGDGTSWADAFTDLSSALAVAAPGEQVWVAAGTYRPDQGTGDRTRSFALPAGVRIYGGFAGGETSVAARDYTVNLTILSGDLAGDDDGTPETTAENALHVVDASNADADTVLDGFMIRAGNADGVDDDQHGGGLFSEGGSPTLANLWFLENSAAGRGGALFARGGDLSCSNCGFQANASGVTGGAAAFEGGVASTLRNCEFVANRTAGWGGAIDTDDFGTSLAVEECRFAENEADWGGAIASRSSVVYVFRTMFENNHAEIRGGGLLSDCNESLTVAESAFSGNSSKWIGALDVSCSGATIVDTTFDGNTASVDGGAIGLSGGSTLIAGSRVFGGAAWFGAAVLLSLNAQLSMVNSTVAGNDSALSGAIRLGPDDSLMLENSIVWGNTGGGTVEENQISYEDGATVVAAYSCIEGWTGGGDNVITADPLFADLAGGDLRLVSPDSPAIDAGDANAVPDGIDTDLDGNPRFVDIADAPDTGIGPPWVDMGAYEAQELVWSCDPGAEGSGDGCDCGCSTPDPDCGGQGCTEPGCAAPACDTCHDADGAPMSCGP